MSTNSKSLITRRISGYDEQQLPRGGKSGVYVLKEKGINKAIFKPLSEEPHPGRPTTDMLSPGPGLRKGTIRHEGGKMEVLAYLLDHTISQSSRAPNKPDMAFGFSGVPPTISVRCADPDQPTVRDKDRIGSLQLFVQHTGKCLNKNTCSIDEIHKIAVLDIRLANADRTIYNVLDREDGVLAPIDHAYCLPSTFEECLFFWRTMEQATYLFSEDTCKYIESMDADKDIDLIGKYYKHLEIREHHKTILRISTWLLKTGAKEGLTPASIGKIMCRERDSGIWYSHQPSMIEKILNQARCAHPNNEENVFDYVRATLKKDPHWLAEIKATQVVRNR